MSKSIEPPAGLQVFTLAFSPAPSDIDDNGHVNNVVYHGWAQDLAIAHWRARQSPEHLATWAWIALRHEIDYRRPLLPGESAQGRTWVADQPEGPRFDRFVRIDGPDGAMCAQVRTIWCLIDQASGRPKRVPPEVVAPFL